MQGDGRKKHSGAAADEFVAEALHKRRTPVKAGCQLNVAIRGTVHASLLTVDHLPVKASLARGTRALDCEHAACFQHCVP